MAKLTETEMREYAGTLRSMMYEQLPGFSQAAHDYAVDHMRGSSDFYQVELPDDVDDMPENEGQLWYDHYWTLRNAFEKQLLAFAMID